MFLRAALSYFLTRYMAIPTTALWLVLFFKEVRLDTHKAFDKSYQINTMMKYIIVK